MKHARATLICATVFSGVMANRGAAVQDSADCTRSEDSGPTGIVRGIVRDSETRVPLGGASVVLSWRESGDRRSRTLEVETDPAGAFTFCEAPPDATLMVHARYAGESSRGEAVRLGVTGNASVEISVDAPHGRITGQVLDYRTGRPINSAMVELRGTPLQRSSDDGGTFLLEAVPPGVYTLAVSHIGYEAVSDSLALDLGSNVEVVVHLAPDAVPLVAIEVFVRSIALERNGFYERMDRGQGDFITRNDDVARTSVRASDLLRGLVGIRFEQQPGGTGLVPIGRLGCAFRYMLNGNRVGEGFEIDEIPQDWIEALEVYRGPSDIPIEFQALPTEYRGECGVIVIWTRSGP